MPQRAALAFPFFLSFSFSATPVRLAWPAACPRLGPTNLGTPRSQPVTAMPGNGVAVTGAAAPPGHMACVNPATSETYATVLLSTPADVPPARAALAIAQAAWADTPVEDRAAVISAFLDGFVERGEAVAAAISAATGKPAYGAMDELLITAAGGRHIVAGAPEWLADDTSRSCALVAGRTSVVRRVPHGVVSILSPYNFPLWLALGNVLAALLAGNAVMLKVSEAVPGIGLLIEELLAELAEGRLAPLVKVFHGAGDVGAALVDAAVGKPDHVLFIGSVGVGRKVAIAAAAGGVGCTLELGGKDAAIVCADANVSAAAEALSYGMAYNAGQCWYVDCFLSRVGRGVAPLWIPSTLDRRAFWSVWIACPDVRPLCLLLSDCCSGTPLGAFSFSSSRPKYRRRAGVRGGQCV